MATSELPGARRAVYASDPATSRGRLHPEHASPTRSEFQRDRDRIIHSTAFRRLAHKTQVFVPLDGDHFRTRLTHTIEVGQIARALARALALDEDLAEAVALAHDLGHTPFGHAGERALQRCMADHGGFDHNAQALRVVTLLERRYARYDGLDLTFETLEGLVKHNGPLAGPKAARALPAYVAEFDARFPLELDSFSGAEAQAAAIADDIAYDAHDIDDGLRAGLFSLADIAAVPFIGVMLEEIAAVYGEIERARVIHELGRRVITRFVEDVIVQSKKRLALTAPQSVEDVRQAGVAMVAFSPPMAEADRSIKAFLFPRMYRHEKVVGVWERAEQVISRLFPVYLDDPGRMPAEWAELARADGARARHVADYIAGMTDRYALGEYRRLFGEKVALG
ncbi:deoxyguanosinetriphosphate triphosphohydrolase [Methylosinus sp. Sm6]|uniref:deoxyguanosinetriphosphate triphosphohydrolase n=1 Tax=Methylosinus sp. Sm6 TaxID=2866948 RepID=UPI001C994267|nr:deoxyguanosinetriphosphate triphosphohydrolase [Methylosinus sp. Sm6]MBY6243316.1 deoxyguanosinetriphosphate triphosphohydrolase [Methylosinus sp. Sm6]